MGARCVANPGELEMLWKEANVAAYDVEEKARQILEGYALIFDNEVADITALRDNLRRDAGLPEKTDD
jgi:hypothetical protein